MNDRNIKISHWLIRVQDGINFKNSKMPFWGVKKGKNGSVKGLVNKIKKGDILWFIKSKKFGGTIIGMSEFTCYYDRDDEPLVSINTYSNEEQNWIGNEDWSIQIHYKNFYETESQNLKAIIQCAATILNYNTFKDKLPDLEKHYQNFKFYSKPSGRFNFEKNL